MKWKSNFIFSSLIMLFLFSTFLFSTCPNGSQTAIRYLTVGGCEYKVEICYTCNLTSPNNVEIFSFAKTNPSCDPGMNINQVYENLNNQIHTSIFLNELCGLPGPCDQYPGGMWWTFAEDMCWQKELIQYNNQNIIIYFPCNLVNVICYENHRICWDPSIPGFVDLLMQGPEISGDFNCAGMLEPPDPTELNQPSACFFIVTPCYP